MKSWQIIYKKKKVSLSLWKKGRYISIKTWFCLLMGSEFFFPCWPGTAEIQTHLCCSRMGNTPAIFLRAELGTQDKLQKGSLNTNTTRVAKFTLPPNSVETQITATFPSPKIWMETYLSLRIYVCLIR